jgi:predicted DNA-binding WGR domain protein
MRQSKRDKLMNCSTLDELLNVEYGEPGTESRKLFDDETQAFCLAQTLKEERLRAGLTQNVFNRQKCL